MAIGTKKFGVFRGVFLPTFLSVIGVILYLRLGNVVGDVGVVGALLIILLAVSVTFATAFSLSSITTNIRIGSGGAYSIISKTLGLEVGGSVGIPLFLAQAFSVLLYIFGFMEVWTSIFPAHPRILVLLSVLLALFLLTYIDVKYAIRAQLAVFGLVCISLIAIFAGGGWWEGTQRAITLEMGNFWGMFALFFPAVTGLMAGIGLSGELSDPKRQIPKGVLWGLSVSTIIYVLMVFWLGFSVSGDELLSNNLIMADLAIFSPAVMVGILAATFSSALTTLVAAPRILNAMGENSILPFSSWFSKVDDSGEPQNATIFTALMLAVAMPFSSLNSIAVFLTMFFLITYAMINLTVYLEQSLGFVSFRPTLSIPKIVPMYGAIGSVLAMFYINVIIGFLALVFLFTTYLFLVRRKLPSGHGFVRSGLFMAISEWAAKKVMSLPESIKHIWKPNILLPIWKPEKALGNFPLIKAITYPNGTLTALGIRLNKDKDKEEEEAELQVVKSFVDKLGREGIFTSYADIHADDYVHGVSISLEAMEGQFFHPNLLFLPETPTTVEERKTIIGSVEDVEAGLAVFERDESVGLGSEEDIHVWIPSKKLSQKELEKRKREEEGEGDIEETEVPDFYADRRFDLALLIAYRLQRNWAGKINLWTLNEDDTAYLNRLVYEARLPSSTRIEVSDKPFRSTYKNAPAGDLHIFPFEIEEELRELMENTKGVKKSRLFVKDSGQEDILA